MDVANETAQGVLDRALTTSYLRPPIQVALATAALAGGGGIQHLFAKSDDSNSGTTWHVVALAPAGLVTVDASSPRANWTYENSDEDLDEGETLNAALTPLREVVAVRIARVGDASGMGGWQFTVDWQLVLRNGSTIDLVGTRRTRAELDALVVALLAALA